MWRRCRDCYTNFKRMERPLYSHDLNLIEQLWDQLRCAVHARLTNMTTLADLHQMLVEEWDAFPQQCVTKLVTSMRRRCQAVYCSFTTEAPVNKLVSSDLNH
uniref:Tc1-like transposase DDE domain-containing protein n=1 Tax=Pundamilia nyererei TaxID=303518 RepID=A0A3B4H259_9CICH